MLPLETGPMDIIDIAVVTITFLYVLWFIKYTLSDMLEDEQNVKND